MDKPELNIEHQYNALKDFLVLLVNFNSHNIKNSVHTMDAIVSTIDLNNFNQNDIDNIKISLDHIRATLDKFSELTIQKNNENKFELLQLFNSLDILHRYSLKVKNINFKVEYENIDRSVIVYQDFHSLLYLFNNMIINAIAALENTLNPEITLQISYNEEQTKSLKILFSDNGSGIKKEIRDKIFTPYFTTKKGGTGVGLTHVKFVLDTIVGRSITLQENTEQQLTTFCIIFPLEKQNETQDFDY